MSNTDTTPTTPTTTDTASTRGRGIRTRFLGPTDHKGARIRAWIADDGKPLAAVIMPWAYTGSASEEHERAALACLAKARKAANGAFHPYAVDLVGTYLGNGEYAFAIRAR